MSSLLSYFFGILLIVAALLHFFRPGLYRRLLPDWISAYWANLLAGIAELFIGIGLLFPASRGLAGMAFAALMVVFLPLHWLDMFRPRPAVGSVPAAVARFILQFFLIYAGYWIWRFG